MNLEIYETSVAVSIASAAMATTFCYIYRNKHEKLRFLFIYPLASILESFSMDLTYLNISYLNQNISIVINCSIMIFLAIEFFTLGIILFNYSNHRRSFSKIIFGIYSIAYFVFFLISKQWSIDVERFYIIQSSLILAPALIFMYNLFNDDNIYELKDYPPFWICLGVILYSLCTFPITIAKDLFFLPKGSMKNLDLYSINNICYTLLFILLIKSVLCKTKMQYSNQS